MFSFRRRSAPAASTSLTTGTELATTFPLLCCPAASVLSAELRRYRVLPKYSCQVLRMACRYVPPHPEGTSDPTIHRASETLFWRTLYATVRRWRILRSLEVGVFKVNQAAARQLPEASLRLHDVRTMGHTVMPIHSPLPPSIDRRLCRLRRSAGLSLHCHCRIADAR